MPVALTPASSLPAPIDTVLLVEDEFIVADDLRRRLTKAGYQVLGMAATAAEARHLLADAPPTVVLLDIFLKGPESGLELATWLRERQIPFVFLSANLSDEVLAAANRTQPLGFLNKPFREKDVLAALELARYRHAHGEEARLRQQRELQVAVNNAIVYLHNRDELCQAIAAQLDQLVPFTLLSLRIGLPQEQSFYWVVLHKSAAGTFEKVPALRLLGPDAPDALLQRLTEQPPDQMGEQAGTFTGAIFNELCRTQRTVRASRDAFGARALATFPVLLKRHSFTSLQLASPDPAAFTPEQYATVALLLPQLALALDNLLVCEEVEARRRQKAAELALVSAFRNGRELEAIAPAVAEALQQVLPLDLVALYGVDRVLGPVQDGTNASRQPDGSFRLLPAAEFVYLPDAAARLAWQQSILELEARLQQPTLNVGDEGEARRAQNLVARRYGEHLGLRSSMYMPLHVQGRPGAAVVVASRARYAYTARDLRLLQELSRLLALALENLLAFERIKTLGEQLAQENTYLAEEIRTTYNVGEIIGTGPAMQALVSSLGLVAGTDATVLITGETGTGKELVARAVHELSGRAARTMVKVNCAALPPHLIESELFGHEKGSFTGATDKRLGKFELADGSTIFLDEIGELPLELQAKLLRALQEREIERVGGRHPIAVDVRIVAATNRDLKQEVAEGRFRSDLYYRLNVFPLAVPPLRTRPEDVLPLAQHFLQRLGKKLGKPLTGLTPDTVRQLLAYHWPGNVRELEHVLERAAIVARTPTVALAESLVPALAAPSAPVAAPPVRLFAESAREAITAALAQAGGRIRGDGGAAELLGIKATTLEARMKKLGVR
ncbi:response regulator [Hymenobacter sp. UV11]|uniref:sigma 54-interacting transcriptional regulator n=1 Tax=Hymenobacter sp. UV11 TaxID=1849735 RepID=UPI00105F39D9|nr:sigma 54-interacting transcriptional regulator [Hymenobacter sp. UV11]TDN36761.1 Fis family transcriptional regulator [Hymenobacter sp. UV11]TFZ63706.1 response regulator [Hymenobacter sp. UV11]